MILKNKYLIFIMITVCANISAAKEKTYICRYKGKNIICNNGIEYKEVGKGSKRITVKSLNARLQSANKKNK